MATVRPFASADRDAWLEMRTDLYPHEPVIVIESEIDTFLRHGMIDGKPHAVFLATDGNTPLGFAEVSEANSSSCHIESWFVRPPARRQGVGRALILACERWAQSRGRQTLTSDTNEMYPDSPPAHKACGFTASNDNTLFKRDLRPQS